MTWGDSFQIALCVMGIAILAPWALILISGMIGIAIHVVQYVWDDCVDLKNRIWK